MTGRYNALIALALENDVEAHEAVNTCDTLSINAAIAGPTCHLDLNEARLPQEPLNEALKRSWVNKLGKDLVELRAPGVSFVGGILLVGARRWTELGLGFLVLLVILYDGLDDVFGVN